MENRPRERAGLRLERLTARRRWRCAWPRRYEEVLQADVLDLLRYRQRPATVS